MLHSKSVKILILCFDHFVNPIMYWYLPIKCSWLTHFRVSWKDLVVTELWLKAAFSHLFDLQIFLNFLSIFFTSIGFCY